MGEREVFTGDYAEIMECIPREPYLAIYLIEQHPTQSLAQFHYLTSRRVNALTYAVEVFQHESITTLPEADDPLTWRFVTETPKMHFLFNLPNTRWGKLIARNIAISIVVGILPFSSVHQSIDVLPETSKYWENQIQHFINQTFDKMIEKQSLMKEH